jgi:BMFP domain-containing protein YqiC
MEVRLILSLKKGGKMKRHKYLSAVICIPFLTASFLLGIVRNVRGEVNEGVATVQRKASTSEEFSAEREYKWKAKKKFDELSKKINELGAKAEKADSKTKADVKKKMNELREKRAALQINMEKLDAVSKDKWETSRQEVESEMDELEKAYDRSRSFFESE